MISQVWIHRPSGCLYAVAFIRYDAVIAEASDEIEQNEVEAALLDGFDCAGPNQVEWVNQYSNEFDLYAFVNNGVVELD